MYRFSTVLQIHLPIPIGDRFSTVTALSTDTDWLPIRYRYRFGTNSIWEIGSGIRYFFNATEESVAVAEIYRR